MKIIACPDLSGVHTSYDIVKAHGGELSFNSDPAIGTQFTITIKTTES